MNFWITLLLVIAIMALIFLGLAIQVIFKKTHEFPNMHIGSNKHLKEKGITCATSWDKLEQKNAKEKEILNNLRLSKSED